MGAPSKQKGPRSEREPLGKQIETAPQGYDEARETAQILFPSWDLDYLRQTIESLLFMATPEQVLPGVVDSACAFLHGAGTLQVHFDGKGGVMIDPESDRTPAMFELGRALKLVLGDQLTVGRPGVSV